MNPLLLLVALLCACSQTTNLVSSELDAASPDAQTDDAAPRLDAGYTLCNGHPCECDNGLDDDGDGLVDGLDGECSGPHDDDEQTFATGQVPQGNPRCSDCFFDGNAGFDDGCQIAAQCSLDGTPGNAPASCSQCSPTAQCIDSCQRLTPNGCDCFGCCEVHTQAGVVNVQLVDSCSVAAIADPVACPRCLPIETCRNPCGRCELCLGRQPADLPADCSEPDGLPYTCDDADVCGPSRPCAQLQYCGQGCCLPVVL